MAGYLYYHLDFSILSDDLFDRLCKQLLSDYANIRHRHKTIITYDHLTAGSLWDLTREDYPSMCRSAAVGLVYDHYGILLEGRLYTITLDDDRHMTYITTPR